MSQVKRRYKAKFELEDKQKIKVSFWSSALSEEEQDKDAFEALSKIVKNRQGDRFTQSHENARIINIFL